MCVVFGADKCVLFQAMSSFQRLLSTQMCLVIEVSSLHKLKNACTNIIWDSILRCCNSNVVTLHTEQSINDDVWC